jgi:hypothetical protein
MVLPAALAPAGQYLCSNRAQKRLPVPEGRYLCHVECHILSLRAGDIAWWRFLPRCCPSGTGDAASNMGNELAFENPFPDVQMIGATNDFARRFCPGGAISL